MSEKLYLKISKNELYNKFFIESKKNETNLLS